MSVECFGKEGVSIMRVHNNTILMVLNIMFVLALIITPTDALAACLQPDAPDCWCFNDAGEWHPTGAFIQDVALETLGTVESCECPGIFGADCPYPLCCPTQNEPGKPYYQMVLGCNSEGCALLASLMLSVWGNVFDTRQTWCTETVAYWHRETGIPFPGGYRRNWRHDWQMHSTRDVRMFYQTEEELAQDGRGRWIDPCDVNYVDLILGVTVPVPGAFIQYQNYDDVNDRWIKGVHSLIINHMTIHEDINGNIFRVDVNMLEGNHSGAGGAVINTRHWDDILSLTPQGEEWINGRAKIRGFGIDHDSLGQPLYDPARLHWEFHPDVYFPPQTMHVEPNDPVWEHYYAPKISQLVTYAQMLLTTGGPNVTCSSPVLQINGIPDGLQVHWDFPSGLTGGVEIDIDLMDVHPLPIKGMALRWDGNSVPPHYRVQFAAADQQYKNALVPDLNDVPLPSPPVPIPVPAIFTLSESGVEVRYVKLIFPSTFQQDAVLQELRFRYYQPFIETDMYECNLVGDLDGDCRIGFSDFARMATNWLVDCMVNSDDPECVHE
jgi:hypothetical protein